MGKRECHNQRRIGKKEFDNENEREKWMRKSALKWKGIRMERSGEKERVWHWKRMMVNKRMETMKEKESVTIRYASERKSFIMWTNERNEWEREYIALKWTGIRIERSGKKERAWQWKRMMANKRMETMNEKERL